MIPSLYKKFRLWSNEGSVWLISDPHFDDKESLEYNKDWLPTDKYVEKLNKIIYKKDTLICLGDCGNLEWVKKLKVEYKVLVKGNHDDKGNSFYQRNLIETTYNANEYTPKDIIQELRKKYPNDKIICEKCTTKPTYYVLIDNMLFDEVYDGPLFISDKILLSHEPIDGLSFCVNIHGHRHGGQREYLDKFGCKHLNIASDVIGFEPINLGQEIKKGLISKIETIHRQAINKRN